MKGFIAIDGGGSKSEVVLVDILGNILKHKIIDCTNPNDVGIDVCINRLTNVLIEFLNDSKIEVESIFLAIAGIEFGNLKNVIKNRLIDTLSFKNIYVDGDLASVKELGLKDYKDGVVIISGTGFNMAIKNNNIFTSIGGWGYLADDYFSGFDLGKEALVRCSRSINKVEGDTILVNLLEKHFNNNLWYSMAEIYRGGVKKVASLSKFVIEAYLKEDQVARNIIDNRLVNLSKVIRESCKLIEGRIKVCLFGGIFENNEFLVKKLQELLTDKFSVEVTRCKTIYGTSSLAIKTICLPNEEFYINFDNSYRGLL